MDTVKAVFVLFLGAYILLGDGPRWLGVSDGNSSSDAGSVDGLALDGLRDEATSQAGSARIEMEVLETRRGMPGSCSALLALEASVAESSVHLASRTPGQTSAPRLEAPHAPPAESATGSAAAYSLGPDECVPEPDAGSLAAGALLDPAH